MNDDAPAVGARGENAMTRRVAFGTFAIVVLSSAGLAAADRPMRPPVAFLQGVGTLGTKYHGGTQAIAFMVDVESPVKTPIPNGQVMLTWQPLPNAPTLTSPTISTQNWGYGKTFEIKPGSQMVAITPNEALPVCGSAVVNVKLFPEGNASIDNTWRHTHIKTANCSYSSKFQNPWDSIEPDRVDAQKQGVVYLNTASISKVPSCANNDWAEVSMQLVNRSGKQGEISVTVMDPDGKTTDAFQTFTIKANQTLTPSLKLYRPTRTGVMSIKVTGKIPVASQATSFDFEGECDIAMDPLTN